MKRLIALSFVFVFMLCGCGTKKVFINFSSMSFCCDTERNGEYKILFETGKNLQSVSATVENLDGMKYTFKNNAALIDYKNIKLSKSFGDIKTDDIVFLLYKIFGDANGKTAKRRETNYVYDGEVCNIKYSVSVSPAGLPLGLTVKNKGITAEFSNLTLVKS